MSRIYYLMGKSASGKDTLYKRLREMFPGLGTIILYTTRPMRSGETDGVEYHFTSEDQLLAFQQQGKMIELRTYQTVSGPWSYATVDDGQIDLESRDYLMIGTLESYRRLRDYFGSQVMVPLYVYLDDGLRLMRAVTREMQQEHPQYQELCRRFLADDRDFSEEQLKVCGITHGYENRDIETCLGEITRIIAGE